MSATHATSKTLSLLDLMEAPAAEAPAPAATEKPKKRARKVAPGLAPAFEGSHTITQGDVLAVLRELPANSFDACLCDPPYGFSFMGKKWDYDVPSVDVWRELLRVLKPGAPLVSFGGTRTFHRVAVGIEDAGFELRDVLSWMYGSGFPKSLDISIALTRWLARLIMPPTTSQNVPQLIVPFSGAGSEMIGALQAGWPSVFGIEGEAEYVDIANARIAAWKKGSP